MKPDMLHPSYILQMLGHQRRRRPDNKTTIPLWLFNMNLCPHGTEHTHTRTQEHEHTRHWDAHIPSWESVEWLNQASLLVFLPRWAGDTPTTESSGRMPKQDDSMQEQDGRGWEHAGHVYTHIQCPNLPPPLPLLVTNTHVWAEETSYDTHE